MKYKRFSYLNFFFLLLCFGTAKGQTVNIQSDNVKWSANAMTDENTNVTETHRCQFITYGSSKIDWVQNNGNFILHFTIMSVTEDLFDPSNSGSTSYTISGEQLSGKMTISKSPTGITISLKLTGGTNDINLSYPISSYEKI